MTQRSLQPRQKGTWATPFFLTLKIYEDSYTMKVKISEIKAV